MVAWQYDMIVVALFCVPVFIVIVILSILIEKHISLVVMLFLVYGLAILIISWLYFARAESSVRQATRGKIAIGVIVVDEAGRRISFRQATKRFFISALLYFVTFGLEFIPALFSKNGVFLHDYLSKTRVIPSTSANSKCSSS